MKNEFMFDVLVTGWFRASNEKGKNAQKTLRTPYKDNADYQSKCVYPH